MLWYNFAMECKRCGKANIIKYGSRRGKPCYLCKNCGHQFISVTAISKYNDYDKYIAIFLYDTYTYYKSVHGFIGTELRLSHIAKILDIKYSTVDYWVKHSHNFHKKFTANELIKYLKTRENGRDIAGLLYPTLVKFFPSKQFLNIIKHK